MKKLTINDTIHCPNCSNKQGKRWPLMVVTLRKSGPHQVTTHYSFTCACGINIGIRHSEHELVSDWNDLVKKGGST